MYTITLADGTQLKKLELNGNNYIAPNIVKDSMFKDNLSIVTISDGENTETYYNMTLIQNTTYDDGKSWFILAPSNVNYTLEELCKTKTSESKQKLAVFLEENPLPSNVHGGKLALYNVTAEKQSLLTSTMLMAQGAVMANIPYEISWNAVGETCETWTMAELQQLAFEIAHYVKPFVSHQRTLEANINKCETVEDVMAIEIDYVSVLAGM
jgi:hypothetical protein